MNEVVKAEVAKVEVVKEFGINETKDVLIAVNKVALLIIQRLKDGVDIGDAMAFWQMFVADGHVKDAVTSAYENYNKIPEELTNLSVTEALDLVKMQMDFIPKIMDAIKA